MNTDGLAILLLGLYLIGVGVGENQEGFVAEVKTESRFFKFALALVALLAINKILGLGKFGDNVVFLVFVILALNVGGIKLNNLE